MDKWAEWAKIPDLKNPGQSLSGSKMTEIFGVESKSWDPSFNLDDVVDVANEALTKQGISSSSIDSVIVGTCTPYEPFLDMDAFYLMKKLDIKSSVAPMQLNAGCAGLVRMMNLAYAMGKQRVLLLTWMFLGRMVTSTSDNSLQEQYRDSSNAWMSPALFSDGIGVMVIDRDDSKEGISFHEREIDMTSRLIEYRGGGARKPDLAEAENFRFEMDGPSIKEYYGKGMTSNDTDMLALFPSYKTDCARMYFHQASPKLVQGYLDSRTDLPKDKIPTNAKECGNMVVPCTIDLLCKDLEHGKVQGDDKVTFQLVGAGPERGGFVADLAIANL